MNEKELEAKIEVLYNQKDRIEDEIDSMFKSIIIHGTLVYKVTNFHTGILNNESYEFDFIVSDKDNKYHWSSEIVRVDISINKNLDIESKFNTGAGGWNDFQADVLMDVFINSLQMGKDGIHIAKNNVYKLVSEHLRDDCELKQYDDMSKRKGGFVTESIDIETLNKIKEF